MKKRSMVVHSLMVVSAAGASVAPVSAATLDIATHKDSLVYTPTATTAGGSRQGIGFDWELNEGVRTLAIFRHALTYIAFDLSALPSGAQMTSATLTVWDQRETRSQTADVTLMNVAGDWAEAGPGGETDGAMDWDEAVANYGAMFDAVGEAGRPDPSLVAWEGDLTLDADRGLNSSAPADPYTAQDLADALQNDLVNGDGIAVFILSMPGSGSNNYILERTNGENPGPVLNVEYVPEPASLGLLGAGLLTLASRRRRA